ncbi:hypothetical protein WMY93_033016 [Mugilogobius chulae]|uniref:Uncharacterized protein n=1 Tax=Mugilogobius chulae TaxID=88201 RepID=A0AAW0MT50_9GOBI
MNHDLAAYNCFRRVRVESEARSADTEASAVAAQLLEKPVTLHRDIRSVLELQKSVVSVDAAVSLAEKALQKFPDSRYLKSCLSMSLKWQVEQLGETASQELIERTAHLLSEVISLYPDSCFKTEIDRANVLGKSNHSLSQADRIYQDCSDESWGLCPNSSSTTATPTS